MHNTSSLSVTLQLPLIGGLGLLLLLTTAGSFTAFPQSSEGLFSERLPLVESPYVAAASSTTVHPLRDWSVPTPLLTTDTALIIDDLSGVARPLLEHNATQNHPLASVIKLLTAITVLDRLDPGDHVTITVADVQAPEAAGGLHVGETISVHDLLAALLVESSNDAAHALARVAGNGSIEEFVHHMRQKADDLDIHNIAVADPMGISPNTTGSAYAAVRLLQESLAHPTIAPLLRIARFDTPSHTFRSTHSLFATLDNIIGSKTGYTEEAGQNLVMQRRLTNGRIVTSVVLGSRDREQDTRALHTWVAQAFRY